jgi:hypothetical protein
MLEQSSLSVERYVPLKAAGPRHNFSDNRDVSLPRGQRADLAEFVPGSCNINAR